MKKLGKFIFGTLSLAALAGGAFYFLKNFANKTATDDFEDFEDDFEEFEDDFEDDFDSFESPDESKKEDKSKADTREYVTINISPDTENLDQVSNEEVAESKDEAETDTIEK